MSKKRIDKENDSSSLKKVAKAGAAALALGGGAAFFNNSAFGKRIMTETLPSVLKAKKALSKEIRDTKSLRTGFDRRTTGKDLEKGWKAAKDVYDKSIKSIRDSKKPLNIKSNKKDNLFGVMKHFDQQLNIDGLNKNRQLYGETMQAEFVKRMIPAFTKRNDSVGTKRVTTLANNAFTNIKEMSYIGKNGELKFSNKMSKMFKSYGYTAKEEYDFLETVFVASEEISANKKNVNNFKFMTAQLKDIFDDTIKGSKKNSDTFYSKFDNWMQKMTGRDFDSEMSFRGSKALTVKDLKEVIQSGKLEKKDFEYNVIDINGKDINKNFLDSIDELNLDDDIIIDKSLRIDRDGKLLDYGRAKESFDSVFTNFSSSIVGKIFAMTDYRLSKEKSAYATFSALKTGIEAIYEDGYDGGTISLTSKVAINNPSKNIAKLYSVFIDENNVMKLNEEALAEGILVNNDHGKSARLMKDMLGSNIESTTKSNNRILEALDINQSKNVVGINRLFVKGDEEMMARKPKNILKRQIEYIQGTSDINEYTLDGVKTILEDNKSIIDMFDGYTAFNQVSDDSVSALLKSGNIKKESSQRLLNILNSKDYDTAEELLRQLGSAIPGGFMNKDLENIYNKGLANSDYLESMMNISRSAVPGVNPLGNPHEFTNVMPIEDIIKREVLKDVLLRESEGGRAGGIPALETILQTANMDPTQKKALRALANWSIMENTIGLYNDVDAEIDINVFVGEYGHIRQFNNLFDQSTAFKQGYIEMLDDMSSRHKRFDFSMPNASDVYHNEYNRHAFLKKSAISQFSLLNNINDNIKILGEAAKETVAGRRNMQHYTRLTQLPQFFVSRLNWAVEGVGVNLSEKYTGSTLDMVKGIALTRVLPALGVMAAYDYLDYESENFTGTSFSGALANTASNIDMNFRKLAYATGVGQALDAFKETSVLAEYWTGSTDFQTAEEREEWYKNGYNPVRGGRWWSFGSSSEYRGGNLQYWQPNYLKRAHSNYHEVSVYGSAEEKFKHSWIPSVRHPFSTLKALWDPYWLEKKNMDERPYPLTGKMFAEGTAWGAILNPTVGEILKPVRMLPEVRQRLGRDGRDIKTVLKSINERIKSRGEDNSVLMIDGTDIRNIDYRAYGNVGDGNLNINVSNGRASSKGIDFVQGLQTITPDMIPEGEDDYSAMQTGGFKSYVGGIAPGQESFHKNIIEEINESIKAIGNSVGLKKKFRSMMAPVMPDRTQGTYVYNNLVNMSNSAYSNYYDYISNGDMVNKSIGANYAGDAWHSAKQLSGIYAFLGDMAFGDDSYQFRYANAGDMYSGSRRFWDSNIGGLGGEFMEIARRFFPSEDKSIIRYNPLRNTMPEWLPERFLTGDPFTSLPKGEMRLPGAGYETLNNLNPDEYGEYGAFDRFKILADIAPTSNEYKLWRNIARNTVQDPELVAQMEEIQSRASRQSGSHEFYGYRYYKNDISMKKGVVKSIDGTVVELQSGEKLNLAGINVNETLDMSQVLHSGQHINYRTTDKAMKRLEDGLTVNAAIYSKGFAGGENINKKLISLGMAEKNKEDRSAIGYLANASPFQQSIGALQEFIGHANIPYIHNKFFKIETALESFYNENVYGSAFSTWDNPIRGFITPALNNTARQGMLKHGVAAGTAYLYSNINKITKSTKAKYMAGAATAMTNPAAFLGMGMGALFSLGVKKGDYSVRSNVEVGGSIGAAIGSIAWGYHNADNPLKAAMSFAMAGEAISKHFKLDEFEGWKWLNKNKSISKIVRKTHGNGKGALIGAAIGLGLSAIKNPNMNKDMFSKWVPEATKKKFEIDEYFDRLEYVKYQGLYNTAARRAISEGVNIRAVFKRIDKNKEKIAKLTRKAQELSNKYSSETYTYRKEMSEINQKIAALESQQTIVKGGDYANSAVAYKKAMESTVYGLSANATPDEILAAIPDQYKDHFMNFINETNAKEQKKILAAVPEFLKKPLQIAWNKKPTKLDSNREYFKEKTLPGITWKGWRPNTNLKHVKMKTIQNEGMLLSDFGYYESEKSKAQYHMADGIDDMDRGNSSLEYMLNMSGVLSGLGMTARDISVTPTSTPGLSIVGNITQTVSDFTKVAEYGVSGGLNWLASAIF